MPSTLQPRDAGHFLLLALSFGILGACQAGQAGPPPAAECQPVTVASSSDGRAGSGSATLGIQLSASSVAVGDSFQVEAIVSAGSQSVDAAAVYLNFDPSKLQVVDSEGAASGLQVTPG